MARHIALGVLIVGLVLMVMMIVVESEPGALPLLMVLSGSVGYVVARRRERARNATINAPRDAARAASTQD